MDKELIPSELRPRSNAALVNEYRGLLKEAEARSDERACKILRRYIREAGGES